MRDIVPKIQDTRFKRRVINVHGGEQCETSQDTHINQNNEETESTLLVTGNKNQCSTNDDTNSQVLQKSKLAARYFDMTAEDKDTSMKRNVNVCNLEKKSSFLDKFRTRKQYQPNRSDENETLEKRQSNFYVNLDLETNKNNTCLPKNYVRQISKKFEKECTLDNVEDTSQIYENIDFKKNLNVNRGEHTEDSTDSHKTDQENYLKIEENSERNDIISIHYENCIEDYDSFDDSDVEDSMFKEAELEIDKEEYVFVDKCEIEKSGIEKQFEKADNIVQFQRTLWQEMPEVINSGLLDSLTVAQKISYETKFEILTTEMSYSNSINIFYNHFYKEIVETKILTDAQEKMLFGNIEEIRNCSKNFLNDLMLNWEQNFTLEHLCDILIKYAKNDFSAYVTYCKHQIVREHMLNKIRDVDKINNLLQVLELDPVCESLSFHSYIITPIHRVTRLPILVNAVLKKMEINDPEYCSYQVAYKELTSLVELCNEQSNKVHKEEEFIETWKMLEFSQDVGVPTLNPNIERCLERKANFIEYSLKMENKFDSLLTKKSSKIPVTLFLFTDILIISKQKSIETYMVLDHCARNLIEINYLSVINNCTTIQITLLENTELKEISWFLGNNDENEIAYWMVAFESRISPYPNEVLYELWDCPLVKVIKKYTSINEDTLNLEPGEIIKISRKCNDWYFGELENSKQSGWFPINNVEDAPCNYTRALNIKKRYRILSTIEF